MIWNEILLVILILIRILNVYNAINTNYIKNTDKKIKPNYSCVDEGAKKVSV